MRHSPPPALVIRAARPEDSFELLAIARGTGVFKPLEIVALEEVLSDYHAVMREQGHRAASGEFEGRLAAFAYYAPAAMTDRTWYLYWIAVEPLLQGRGIGRALLEQAEDEIAAAGGRLLLIETSSLAHYEPTRSFYLAQGYQQAAVVADYYADGDDMVVFRKRFA